MSHDEGVAQPVLSDAFGLVGDWCYLMSPDDLGGILCRGFELFSFAKHQ